MPKPAEKPFMEMTEGELEAKIPPEVQGVNRVVMLALLRDIRDTPVPQQWPAMNSAVDPASKVVRIAAMYPLDVRAQLIRLRWADIKRMAANIMILEANLEASQDAAVQAAVNAGMGSARGPGGTPIVGGFDA